MNPPAGSLKLFFTAVLVFAAMLVIAGCTPKTDSSASTSAPTAASETAAANELTLYQQQLAANKPNLAALVGEQIVQKYPGTAAALEVQKALPALKARARHEKLAALWLYQTETMDGLQYTAAIYSSEPSGLDNQVQLVLRRHVGWPQSAYLYGHGNGFVCKKVCNLVMRVDGKPEIWKAYLPQTGEPAMFIEDDKGFIAELSKAQVIEMDVTTKDHGPETLKFEVGGYDPSKFLSLPKK